MKKQADLAETVNSIERMLKRLIRSVASSSPSQDRGE
jgi:hypothetical protein